MPLPARKTLFVSEYLVDLSATRAGYSAKTAKQQGHRLLQDPAVQEAVEEARAAREKRTHITQDRVLRELARIGVADIRRAERARHGAGNDNEFRPICADEFWPTLRSMMAWRRPWGRTAC